MLLVPILSRLHKLALSAFRFMPVEFLLTDRRCLTHSSSFHTTWLFHSRAWLSTTHALSEEIITSISSRDSLNHRTEDDLLVLTVSHGFSRVNWLISARLLVFEPLFETIDLTLEA